MADEMNVPETWDINKLLTGGWSAVDQQPTPEQIAASQHAIEAAQMKRYEDAQMVTRFLDQPGGKEFMNWMARTFVYGRRFDPDDPADRAAFTGFFREGQASVYFEFNVMRAIAEQGPPDFTQPTDEGTADDG